MYLELPETSLELLCRFQKHAKHILPEIPWAIGGGSVLSARWHHRTSEDLDVFISEVDWIRWRDADGPQRLARSFATEQGRLHELGDRGVSVTGIRLDTDWYGTVDVVGLTARAGGTQGRDRTRGIGQAAVLDSETILAAKLMGRGWDAVCRDIYDLAVGLESEPDAVDRAVDRIRTLDLGLVHSAIMRTPWRPETQSHQLRCVTRPDTLRRAPRRVAAMIEAKLRARDRSHGGTRVGYASASAGAMA